MRIEPRGYVLAAPLLLVVAACHEPLATEILDPGGRSRLATPMPSGVYFVDAAASTGLDFVHFNGMSGELFIAEVMGAGVGLLDYDNDGDLDVYLVQGSVLAPGVELAASVYPPPPAMLPLHDRLYRNELDRSELRFSDQTESSGLRASGYGMGVATGDVDNDGWVDLYLTNLGPNQLWRNRGDGSFEDITAASGTDDPRWSMSAAFVDADGDGWLDLYVTNYVDFAVAAHKRCRYLTGAPDYCGPLSYRPQGDRFFRNRGDGTFEDQTAAATGEPASGLGVVSADLDGDGLLDLYVANDGMANHLLLQRQGRFVDEALPRGAGLSLEGMAEAGMGVVAADDDGDGDEDLLVSHLALETNTLYRNDGRGYFDDASIRSGLGPPSLASTGFGIAWTDFDNDGWLDLLVVNGGVKIIAELAARGERYPLHMPNQLFRNLGDGRYAEISKQAGEVLSWSEVSRGLAAGDLDNDGDTDAVISNNSGPVRLLLNQVGQDRRWLGLRLLGTPAQRDMLGAWVGVERQSTSIVAWRRARTDGSYLSAHDPRLLFGLGDDAAAGAVLVRWPSGRQERFVAPPLDRYSTLIEGSGEEIQGGC